MGVYEYEETDVQEEYANNNNYNIVLSNYPNPFNPVTTLNFSIKNGETGKLSIFNAKGQLIE